MLDMRRIVRHSTGTHGGATVVRETRIAVVGFAALVVVSSFAAAADSPAASAPLTNRLREIVSSYAEPKIASGEQVGLAIGVVRSGHTAVFGFGRKNTDSPEPPDGRTVFPSEPIPAGIVAATPRDASSARNEEEGVFEIRRRRVTPRCEAYRWRPFGLRRPRAACGVTPPRLISG